METATFKNFPFSVYICKFYVREKFDDQLQVYVLQEKNMVHQNIHAY